MNRDRTRIVLERVEVALEQILRADKEKLPGLLYYWFNVMFDEGLQMASMIDSPTIKMTTAKLQEMNERLKKHLGDDDDR